jgi:dTDP-4-dehydrorhamnose reductase
VSKRLIIIGASGVIGAALRTSALKAGHHVIATAKSKFGNGLIKFDIEKDSLLEITPDLSANDVVYILAANTSHKIIDKNPRMARKLNVDGTIKLCKEVLKTSAHIIFMSTDQVFDGKLGGYTEESKTNPLNNYGRMKVYIENWLLNTNSTFTIARTGWNVPHDIRSNCVIKNIHSQMKNNKAILAKDNIISLTDVTDTANSLVCIAELSSPPKICHIVSDQGISRAQIGNRIKKSSLYPDELNYTQTVFQDLPIAKKRPAIAWMSNNQIKKIGCSFLNPNEVISQKVGLIEKYLR